MNRPQRISRSIVACAGFAGSTQIGSSAPLLLMRLRYACMSRCQEPMLSLKSLTPTRVPIWVRPPYS